MVVVHVARRGRETGSSSDRVVAGDGLRPMYLHNKRQEKKPEKLRLLCSEKIHRILLSSSLCVLRAPGDRAPAFAGVPVSSRGSADTAGSNMAGYGLAKWRSRRGGHDELEAEALDEARKRSSLG